MHKLLRFILLIFSFYFALSVYGAEALPPAVKGFCALAFAGKIANKGQAFNATDVIDKGVPQRRVIDYVVDEHVAYLWYEHGGRGYHQHLVEFSKTPPYELKKNYVFDKTTHTHIQKLINDTRFLNSHVSNQCGL